MKYINETNFWYFAKGLTYTKEDLEVLDKTLDHYNTTTGLIDSIVEAGFSNKIEYTTGQLLINLDKYLTSDNKNLTTASIIKSFKENKLPPVLLLNLQSPSLQVPQRVEIPLKYILQGLPLLSGTSMVYLHAIILSNNQTYSYYGKTKRGWMTRFMEHVKLAMKGSNRKFPELFGKAIEARYEQLYGNRALNDPLIYAGSYHVVCSAGLDSIEANSVERYLITKKGLDSNLGLNMV